MLALIVYEMLSEGGQLTGTLPFLNDFSRGRNSIPHFPRIGMRRSPPTASAESGGDVSER
jgi:hypothetical protein